MKNSERLYNILMTEVSRIIFAADYFFENLAAKYQVIKYFNSDKFNEIYKSINGCIDYPIGVEIKTNDKKITVIMYKDTHEIIVKKCKPGKGHVKKLTKYSAMLRGKLRDEFVKSFYNNVENCKKIVKYEMSGKTKEKIKSLKGFFLGGKYKHTAVYKISENCHIISFSPANEMFNLYYIFTPFGIYDIAMYSNISLNLITNIICNNIDGNNYNKKEEIILDCLEGKMDAETALYEIEMASLENIL